MAALPADRYNPTLGMHSRTRIERVSYTPISKWWSFHVDLSGWTKCFTWSLG
jgi:hypothetical protein